MVAILVAATIAVLCFVAMSTIFSKKVPSFLRISLQAISATVAVASFAYLGFSAATGHLFTSEPEEPFSPLLSGYHASQADAENAVYTGEFKDGQFDGEGTLQYADGTIYSGTFVKGLREGSGTLTLQSGESYEGQWSKDEMHGEGTYIYKDGSS